MKNKIKKIKDYILKNQNLIDLLLLGFLLEVMILFIGFFILKLII